MTGETQTRSAGRLIDYGGQRRTLVERVGCRRKIAVPKRSRGSGVMRRVAKDTDLRSARGLESAGTRSRKIVQRIRDLRVSH